MKIKISKLLLTFCLFTNFVMLAQPGDTDGTPTDNLEGTDPLAPINSYLLLVALIGVHFAFATLKKQFKLMKMM